MRQTTLLLLLAIVGSAVLSGCKDDPDPVGSRLLPPSDFLEVDSTSLASTASGTLPAFPNGLFASRSLIGKTPDYEAWTLILFAQPPANLIDAQVLTAKLGFFSDYHVGDSAASFSFAINKGIKAWDGDSLTFDSLLTGAYHEATSMPPVSLSSFGDRDSLFIDLDTSLVSSWYTTVDGKLPPNYGLVLQPTNSAVIKGLGSFNSVSALKPRLVVTYRPSGLVGVETATLQTGIDRFLSSIGNAPSQADSMSITVQNGVAYRATVSFDINNLPKDAPIHKAILEVYLDESQSTFGPYTNDSLVAFFMDEFGFYETIYALNAPPERVGGFKTYRFSIYPFVQRWVRGTGLPRVAISGFGENNSLDKFVLFGSAASVASLRPRLTIIYSPAL